MVISARVIVRGSRLEASAGKVRPVFSSPKLRAKELESLSERIRDRRDASLGKGRMSEAPWHGLVRDYMWAVACAIVTNDQVGCSACFWPLPEDERNSSEGPYFLSERAVWPVQVGVPGIGRANGRTSGKER